MSIFEVVIGKSGDLGRLHGELVGAALGRREESTNRATRLITLLLCTADVVLAFALSVPLIISGYEDWIGVLADSDANGPTKQWTLYSVLARDAVALGIGVATTIFAWEQQKRHNPQIGGLVIVLALLLARPVIYVATH